MGARQREVADPGRVDVPTAELLTPEYAAVRRALVTDRAGTPAPGDPARGGTVYLCAGDVLGGLGTAWQGETISNIPFPLPCPDPATTNGAVIFRIPKMPTHVAFRCPSSQI